MKETFKKIALADTAIISLFYSLAFGIMLLNPGIFLDDWFVYSMNKEDLIKLAIQAGKPLSGYFWVLLLAFKNLLLCRLAVFFSFLFSGLLLNGILKNIKEIDKGERLLIVLISTLYPVNFFRLSLGTADYAFCNFLFFFGFWMLTRYLKTRSLYYRIGSLAMFFCSFFTHSLLCFYAVVLLYLLYAQHVAALTNKERLNVIGRFLDFAVLPGIFWCLKLTLLKQSGIYENYNKLSLGLIPHLPLPLLTSFYYNIYAVLDYSLKIFSHNYTGILLLSIAIFFMLSAKQDIAVKADRRDLRFFLLGILVFLCGLFPYLLLGYTPLLGDYQSRHQLLVPLGAGFILFYGCKIFFARLGLGRQKQVFCYSFITALFVVVNFFAYLDFQRDWFKQLAIVEEFRSSEVIKGHTTFLFDDRTAGLNAHSRVYRYYEYNALFNYALGDETRFGENLDPFRGMPWYQTYIKDPTYLFRDYKPKEPEYKVIITPGAYTLEKFPELMRLWYRSYFDRETYRKSLLKVLRFEYVKLAPRQ